MMPLASLVEKMPLKRSPSKPMPVLFLSMAARMGCSPATGSRSASEVGPRSLSTPRNTAVDLPPSLTSRPRSSTSPWPLGTNSRRLRSVSGSCLAAGRSSSSAGCSGCASARTSASASPIPSSVRGSSRTLAAISASRSAVVCSVRRPAVITWRSDAPRLPSVVNTVSSSVTSPASSLRRSASASATCELELTASSRRPSASRSGVSRSRRPVRSWRSRICSWARLSASSVSSTRSSCTGAAVADATMWSPSSSTPPRDPGVISTVWSCSAERGTIATRASRWT